jgi:ATP-binding cassette subfamily B protein
VDGFASGRGRALRSSAASGRAGAAAARLAWRGAPRALTLYALLTVAAGVLPVAAAWLTKLLLDALVDSTAGSPIGFAVALAGVGVVAVTLPQATQFLRAEVDRSVGLLAQDELYGAVERFSGLTRFEDPEFLDHLRLAQQAAGTTPTQLIDGVLGVARGVVMIVGFVVSLALLNPVMILAVAAAAVPALIAELQLSRRRAETAWGISPAERRELFYGQLLGSVEAAKEIRLFDIGAFLRTRMLSERRKINARRRQMDHRELVVQSGLGLLGALVTAAGLVWAVFAARSGRLSIGDVSMFVAGVSGVQGGLSGLVSDLATIHHELLMFDHYLTVVHAKSDLSEPKKNHPMPPLRHGIEFRNVWFRYSEHHPWVLRAVNLVVSHGQAVAVVGPNGAGKSTLIKLLCRFYDPTRGAILWDGKDLRDMPVEELRQRIGAVFQDFMCYDFTAADNIAMGDIDSLGEHHRIVGAAKRAGIHDVLAALPQSYATLLSRTFFGENQDGDPEIGVMLSGGQWQRLALARGFMREKRDLMILDEPTAGLDAEAEHEIHVRLRDHRSGQTSLLVSHRLSAVRDADLIVVLDAGALVEQGTHSELLAAGGPYARLFSLQSKGYEPEGAVPVGWRQGT